MAPSTTAVRRLPPWIPGVVFLQQVLEWKKATDALFDAPFNWVQQKMVSQELPARCRAQIPNNIRRS